MATRKLRKNIRRKGRGNSKKSKAISHKGKKKVKKTHNLKYPLISAMPEQSKEEKEFRKLLEGVNSIDTRLTKEDITGKSRKRRN